jgi:BRCT domain type II-containing protein
MNKKVYPRGGNLVLRGVVVVVSGVLDSMSREDMSAYVTSHGGKVAKSITKGTTHLVNDHGAVGPSKLLKCQAQGVPVVGEDVIFELVRAAAGTVTMTAGEVEAQAEVEAEVEAGGRAAD